MPSTDYYIESVSQITKPKNTDWSLLSENALKWFYSMLLRLWSHEVVISRYREHTHYAPQPTFSFGHVSERLGYCQCQLSNVKCFKVKLPFSLFVAVIELWLPWGFLPPCFQFPLFSCRWISSRGRGRLHFNYK